VPADQRLSRLPPAPDPADTGIDEPEELTRERRRELREKLNVNRPPSATRLPRNERAAPAARRVLRRWIPAGSSRVAEQAIESRRQMMEGEHRDAAPLPVFDAAASARGVDSVGIVGTLDRLPMAVPVKVLPVRPRSAKVRVSESEIVRTLVSGVPMAVGERQQPAGTVSARRRAVFAEMVPASSPPSSAGAAGNDDDLGGYIGGDRGNDADHALDTGYDDSDADAAELAAERNTYTRALADDDPDA
jgi:hypothetical protein